MKTHITIQHQINNFQWKMQESKGIRSKTQNWVSIMGDLRELPRSMRRKRQSKLLQLFASSGE
uniref:Uncharacterized protein n=1 Tax=Rhizophora mucronata TaxID=61149 RepID=A0A2P2M217_RHIMU